MNDEGSAPGRRRLTRAEAKARTREQLLEAAARVFAEKGFSGASVEEIAESAGYSIGALYSNFAGKQQLFLELLSSRRARRVATVAKVIEDVAAGEEDPFGALSRLLVEVADRNREFAPLQAEFWLYAVRHPEAMEILAARLSEQVEVIEQVVAPAMERHGTAPGISPRAVTTVVLALFQGLVRQRRIDPAGVPDDLFAQAIRWLFEGLQGTEPQPGAGRPAR